MDQRYVIGERLGLHRVGAGREEQRTAPVNGRSLHEFADLVDAGGFRIVVGPGERGRARSASCLTNALERGLEPWRGVRVQERDDLEGATHSCQQHRAVYRPESLACPVFLE